MKTGVSILYLASDGIITLDMLDGYFKQTYYRASLF